MLSALKKNLLSLNAFTPELFSYKKLSYHDITHKSPVPDNSSGTDIVIANYLLSDAFGFPFQTLFTVFLMKNIFVLRVIRIVYNKKFNFKIN